MRMPNATPRFGLKGVMNAEVIIGAHHLVAGNGTRKKHHGYQKKEEPGPMLGHVPIVTGWVVKGALWRWKWRSGGC